MPAALTVAIVLLLLAHEPPPVESDKVVDEPRQTDDAPVIDEAGTTELTVTTCVLQLR